MLKASEGGFCSSFQSLAAENWKERRPKEELALGVTSEILPAGAHAKGGCCYGDQRAEIRRGFTWQRLVDDLEPVDFLASMKRGPANESVQFAMVGRIWGFGDNTDGTVIDCIQFAE